MCEPENALLKQYEELLATEEINLTFLAEGISRIAEISVEINENNENIGARRLHTILEKLLEDISFSAPDMREKDVTIDAQYVDKKLKSIMKDRDLSKYIL